ncbi:MAG: YggS family pyridoxal phosphate-dependent enzyme [Cyanothece sp. SIO1E1]|nr:YggS family pyridoxal phosphate-dependent enzyme [Cyanothece sp. SIO1E1]
MTDSSQSESALSNHAIAQRIHRIRQSLPTSVRLIAVTKKVSVDAMRIAYEAGIRDFGESKIQEAALKQIELKDLTDITWHLIGHLQNNKAQKALEQFHWLHSLDSLKLAQRLNRLAANSPNALQVCLQVKVLPDPTKHGWTIQALLESLSSLNDCTNLRIAGLMTIPPYGLPTANIQSAFMNVRELANTINQQGWSRIQIQHLSMGMSEDYQLAIEAGATMVRLGRILFGARTE